MASCASSYSWNFLNSLTSAPAINPEDLAEVITIPAGEIFLTSINTSLNSSNTSDDNTFIDPSA